MEKNKLKNQRILVLGAGKSGLESTKFLKDVVSEVLLSDLNSKPSEDVVNELNKLNIKYEFGKNSDEFLKNIDLVIVSPGISPFTDIIKKINLMGIELISDIELASYFINKPIIGITGTNGKTTTTSLIEHILNSSGKKAVACGNIGLPPISLINKNDIDFFVMELSSYQIFYSPTLSCDIAICTNITPDHLDWHGTFEHYVNSKKKLFLQQNKTSWSIFNLLDPIVKDFPSGGNKFFFSLNSNDINHFDNIAFFEDNILKIKFNNEVKSVLNKNDLKIIGLHNIENSLAALSTAYLCKIKIEEIQNGLKSFTGVEHRLEFVAKIMDKEIYNDSKATNPEATIKAIKAINLEKKGKKIVLILGGRDKNTSLDEMIEIMKEDVNEVILFGEAKNRFYEELQKNQFKNKIEIVENINEAVKKSLDSHTDIVLFSPACASFDMFKNYEERGKIFKQLVRGN